MHLTKLVCSIPTPYLHGNDFHNEHWISQCVQLERRWILTIGHAWTAPPILTRQPKETEHVPNVQHTPQQEVEWDRQLTYAVNFCHYHINELNQQSFTQCINAIHWPVPADSTHNAPFSMQTEGNSSFCPVYYESRPSANTLGRRKISKDLTF